MATPTPILIEALRKAVRQLESNADYQWGHMGCCNCGHLAQTLLKLHKNEIHQAAMGRMGDWSDQLNDYCPTSGYLLDSMIDGILAHGLTRDDLAKLERLSDKEIVARTGERYLVHNRREHVILYMKAWVRLLEERWADDQVTLLEKTKVIAV